MKSISLKKSQADAGKLTVMCDYFYIFTNIPFALSEGVDVESTGQLQYVSRHMCVTRYYTVITFNVE